MIYGWVTADDTAVVVKVVHSNSREATLHAALSEDPSLRVLPIVANLTDFCPAWGLSAIVTRKCLVLSDWIDNHVWRFVDLVPIVMQLVQVIAHREVVERVRVRHTYCARARVPLTCAWSRGLLHPVGPLSPTPYLLPSLPRLTSLYWNGVPICRGLCGRLSESGTIVATSTATSSPRTSSWRQLQVTTATT